MSMLNYLKILMFVITMAFWPMAKADVMCANVFTSTVSRNDQTINGSIENLSKFRLMIERAKSQGDISLELTVLKRDYLAKETELIRYLEDNGIMTRENLRSRMREVIAKLQSDVVSVDQEDDKNKDEQTKVINKALRPFNLAQKMIFNEIKPGSFKMGDAQVVVEITKSFSMMDTPVTQMMWARLKVAMGEKDLGIINPSKFKTGAESSIVKINGIDVQMRADNPVETVSWNDIKKFLDGLNLLSATGNAKIQSFLKKIIPDHKKGDIYDFPTEAQWEFVMRNRGRADKVYFDRDDDPDLANYAWYNVNAGEQTHAVASRQPRMIDGMAFYDLEGNVWEWTKDWYDLTLKGGKDPQGAAAGSQRVIRGGGWNGSAEYLRSSIRSYWKPDVHYSLTGFRLVRTRE